MVPRVFRYSGARASCAAAAIAGLSSVCAGRSDGTSRRGCGTWWPATGELAESSSEAEREPGPSSDAACELGPSEAAREVGSSNAACELGSSDAAREAGPSEAGRELGPSEAGCELGPGALSSSDAGAGRFCPA